MESKRKGDTLFGFISGPSVSVWFMRSVIGLFKLDFEHRFTADFIVALGSYIHQNRNELQAEFMSLDRKWLMMVDNDMVFEPSDVFALLKAADERGPGIYSAPYILEDGVFVCGPWAEESPRMYRRMPVMPDTIVQCGVVGGGFTLIHRDVFTKVGERAFTSLHETVDDESLTHGEDVSFCWRAYEAGFIPWLVPVRPGHMKTLVIYPGNEVINMLGENVNLTKIKETDPIWTQQKEGG